MKLYSIATVVETKQTWADEDDFQVLKPNIVVKVNYMKIVCLLKIFQIFLIFFFYHAIICKL